MYVLHYFSIPKHLTKIDKNELIYKDQLDNSFFFNINYI